MENEKQNGMSEFLLINGILGVEGYKPNLEKDKDFIEQEIGCEIFLKIIEDNNGYIKGTFNLKS